MKLENIFFIILFDLKSIYVNFSMLHSASFDLDILTLCIDSIKKYYFFNVRFNIVFVWYLKFSFPKLDENYSGFIILPIIFIYEFRFKLRKMNIILTCIIR